MSELLDAIAGLPSCCEPLPGLVTGGQPTADTLRALRAAGCEVVVDLRDPMEPRPLDEPAAVRGAGMEYLNIPVSGASQTDQTLARARAAADNGRGRKAFWHCSSGDRTGAVLIPVLMLDRGMSEDDAVMTAMRIGLRNLQSLEWALDYVRRQAASLDG